MWELEQPFAAPNTNDLHGLRGTAIDDPKRRMDRLPQGRLAELGHDPAGIRVIAEHLDTVDDLACDSGTDLGNALRAVPVRERLQISDGGVSQTHAKAWHSAT